MHSCEGYAALGAFCRSTSQTTTLTSPRCGCWSTARRRRACGAGDAGRRGRTSLKEHALLRGRGGQRTRSQCRSLTAARACQHSGGDRAGRRGGTGGAWGDVALRRLVEFAERKAEAKRGAIAAEARREWGLVPRAFTSSFYDSLLRMFTLYTYLEGGVTCNFTSRHPLLAPTSV